MAKVKINVELYSGKDIVDLEDFGHNKESKWSDLSYYEQEYIKDCIKFSETVSLNFEDYE